MLDEMEFGDDGGIEVRFWHFDGNMNTKADALASAVLNGARQGRGGVVSAA